MSELVPLYSGALLGLLVGFVRPSQRVAVVAALSILLGIGASFEGIFRKHMVLPDSIRDSAWYAVVDDDWPRVKAMLEAKIARHVA